MTGGRRWDWTSSFIALAIRSQLLASLLFGANCNARSNQLIASSYLLAFSASIPLFKATSTAAGNGGAVAGAA
jgi:hypothetical protein